MTVLDLIELLRSQDVFDISTVSFAVLEVNGDLSVLLKSDAATVTIGDLNIKKEKSLLPLPVISDGKIISESLNALGVTEEKLNKKLKANKTQAKEIFLMMLDKKENFSIVKKEV